jgi:hypothetical protein
MHSLHIALPLAMLVAAPLAAQSLADKARLLQQNLTERHMLDGLYVSIVPAVEPGVKLLHTIESAQKRYSLGTTAHIAAACASGSCHDRALTLWSR